MLTLSRAQVRRVDQLAIEELGIPGIVLMENASRGVSDEVLHVLEQRLHLTPADARVAIFCGGGNNGGDGYAVARHLHNEGCGVELWAASPPHELTGDAAVNWAICDRIGIPIQPAIEGGSVAVTARDLADAHVLVDALLGTGFSGAVREPLASLIRAINDARRQHGVKTVAVDVPSGLDCDSGEPGQPTIEADVTVTFVAAKRGFDDERARALLGEVLVTGIGAPPELIERVVREGAGYTDAA